MSSFYGSPAGPHIGQCQNFILLGNGPHGHYCLAPVIGLGAELVSDRDVCGWCRMRSTAFAQSLIERHAEGLAAEPESGWRWVDVAHGILDREYEWLAERGAAGEPLEHLFKIRQDIERRERILAAVLDRLPPRVDTLQSAL